MEREVRFCRTQEGVRLAYIDLGDPAGLPFVLVAGLASHIARTTLLPESAGAIDAITAAGGRFICYDARGQGHSMRDVGHVSLDTMVQDLTAVVDHLAVRRMVLYSAGVLAPVAFAFAARQPGRVVRLVARLAYADGAAAYRENPMWEALRSLREADELRETYLRVVANLGSDFRDSAAAERNLAFFRDAISPAVERAYFDAVRAIDITKLLGEIRSSTLLLWSAQDRWPQELVRDVAARVPNARMVTLQGETTSAEATRVIAQFIRSPDGPLGAAVADLSAPRSLDAETAGPALRVILFTDLVEHTPMLRRLGDARGRDVLREHERIVRDLLGRYGGSEIKTVGDQFMASFASAARAVECAIALQLAFAARNANAAEKLNVRMGLDAGEPIEEDGDLFGAVVILASRICAQAKAGEILIPEPVRHLLAGKPFVFADRGAFVPKGFEDAVHLHEVRWRD